MTNQKKNILITGGKGFIGKSLYEQLQQEYQVTSISRNELDLTNSKNVKKFITQNNFEIVIHTATYDAAPKDSSKDPKQVLQQNTSMFFNLTRCSKYFGKMIYFGSGAEFDRNHWKPKMKESYFDQHVPNDPYGLSKYIMNKYTILTKNIYNLRLFGVFGKYEDWRYRFISNICCQTIFDMPITINQNARFDFISINDVIKVVKWVIENTPKHPSYNVCSGKIYDYKTLTQKIIQISGKELPLTIVKPGYRTLYSGCNQLLLNEYTQMKITPINKSLESLYKWLNKNKNKLDKSKLHF